MTILDVMLALGVLVVVPSAAQLHEAAGARTDRTFGWVAVPAAAGVLAGRSQLSAALALPWLLLAAVAALVALRQGWRSRTRPLHALPWVAAAGYLLVGAMWLLADRLDLEPAGFTAPFVQLTAIHFHYAGAASSVIAGATLRALPRDRVALVGATLTASSPPIVALGFTLAPALLVAGALSLAAGLTAVAWVTLRRIRPVAVGTARVLLTVASYSVLAGMVLAVQWALGSTLGTPALSIPAMAATHGVLNGVGFALCGVIGWRLHAARARGAV